MSNNKSPGNDGLTKEFYETFWKDLKKPLCASITKAFHQGELSHSQKQAVIKLLEKKRQRQKIIIKNWRRISLLNINTKLISKVLAERLKNVLPSLECVKVTMPAHQVLLLTTYIFDASYGTSATQANKIQDMDQTYLIKRFYTQHTQTTLLSFLKIQNL